MERVDDESLAKPNDALHQSKKLKKYRSPGVDGMTIERLNSASYS